MSAKRLPFAEVSRAALAGLGRVLDWLGVTHQQAGHEIQMLNPQRSDEGFGSFSINANTGVWADFASGDKGGDVVSLVAYVKGYGQGEACKELARLFGILAGEASPASEAAPPPSAKPAPADSARPLLPIPADLLGRMPCDKYKHPGQVVQMWRYNDAAGLPLVFVARLEPGMNGRSKDYFPLSVWEDAASGKREWRWKNLPAPRPLYGLDRLAERSAAPVVVCEGEKAADAAAKLLPEHVAVCWMNGAEAVGKADFSPLAGRDCLIWRDNDTPGEVAAQAVAGALAKVDAASVRHVDVRAFADFAPAGSANAPELVEGGEWNDGDDAADALARGWTPEHIRLLAEAGRWLVDDAARDVYDAHTPASANPLCDAGTSPAGAVGSCTVNVDGADPQTPPAEPADTSEAKTPAKPAKRVKRPPAGTGSNPFKVTDTGVYFQTEDMDAAQWVCAPLTILARTRDHQGLNWGLLVRFADPDGTDKEWNIPAELLASSEGAEVVKGLLSMGLSIGAGPKARQRLLEYLQRFDGADRATIVNRLGWHGPVFLLPEGHLGDGGAALVYQAASRQRELMACAGSLEGWRAEIGRYCVGNHRFAFAASVAFAAPLLDVVGAESGGFHFFGDSSQGKTTLLQVAASVYGAPGYLQTWRATDNALEAIAAAYSDCLLPLDEIHQCDPRIVGETVYMLGNGRGKARANDRGGARGAVAEWRLLFLSSGEKTLEAHMAEARKDMKAGMEIRLLAVPADAGAGLGLFHALHDQPSGKALADQLKAAVASHYGHPARAFLTRLVSERAGIGALIVEQMRRFAADVVPAGAHGQVHRAAARFALVAVAGELASAWGITGWPKGAAWESARVCFADWLTLRGTSGNREDDTMLGKVRLFFEQHGEARFTRLSPETLLHEQDGNGPDPDLHAPKTLMRCGYRAKDSVSGVLRYYVFPESFRHEVCAGLDVGRVCKLLQQAGALEVTKGSGYLLQTRAIPEAKLSKSGRARVYCVTSNLFADHGHEEDAA
ncbi:DUF927 domain-containing protein [Crenobacter cavernae]|uniref:DUF927 domain-containing protein n=1 Tax=Crenobacter cavernae TaxID=2290923 RepID=A0A345Y9T3_9NEIS|nr:DUF927 domain-containing protein [Crenobacter cavernae]AXK40685.1 DUF927 domain-containing protein [Crenobacter cavernae]